MVRVMKREEDNTIIVDVTVEGVRAAEPGFKGCGQCYVPGCSARGGQFTKLREEYARDPTVEQISRNERWAVAHYHKGGSTGTRIAWTISVCILALLRLLSSAACVIKYCERTIQAGVRLAKLRLEPFDKPQVSQQVYMGVVEGVVVAGTQLAPTAPVPHAAEAQEPEMEEPLPPVNAAALNLLGYALPDPTRGSKASRVVLSCTPLQLCVPRHAT